MLTVCDTGYLPRYITPNPYSVIDLPLPTHRLASSALQALAVDNELSPLVKREFSLDSSNDASADSNRVTADGHDTSRQLVILRTQYKATTNRMLRVAVNGFMESLVVVLGVMEELDVDVLEQMRPV